MSSKFIDNTAIIQVIGNVFKNPKLLDDTDKYSITEDDFPDRFHKIVFGAIYKIYELGANKITLENISDFLSSRPKSEAVYKKEKGEEWLLNVAEMSQSESFDYYYSRLKKFTLLRAYDNCGVNVSDIYDPDNILDIKKKQQQEDLLDNSSLEDLANKVENKISQIRMDYVDDAIGEAAQAGENISELIDKFKKYPEVGIPLFGPLVNTVTRGARLKKFYLRSAPTGCGKALLNSTLIPTPNGYKKVGEIKEGDYLFGDDGKPVKVLKVHPQPNKKQVWRVIFEDGRIVKCCGEHLWSYYENNELKTASLEEISKKNYSEFSIPITKPVEYPEKEFLIKPYNMGKKFGNGITVFGRLQLYEYLTGSLEQRRDFLKGVFHVDPGIISKDGTVNYIDWDVHRRKFFLELLYSLGYKARYYPEEGTIKFKVHKNDLNLIKKNIKILKESKDNFQLYIKHIGKINEYEEMTCFTVDNNSHLFLTNNYVVTHNTRTMIADACYVSCGMYYDDTFGWIKTGYKEPSLYITTEQELEEAQTMMLAFISGVNEEKILNGNYSEDEEERVVKAGKILKQAPLYIEELPDFSLKDVENVIKKNIREHDINYLFYDYIHTSLKILEEISKRSGGVKLREDNILFMLSTRLKDLCNKYGIFILSSTQLNGSYVESENPDQNLLRGSKAIADKIDIGELILPVKDKDIDALDSILSSGTFDKPTLKLSFYKNRRGRYKNVILWCKSDLGCCRVIPMFCTTYDYELININDLKINIVNEEESAF